MKRCVLLACCIVLSASSVSAGIGALCIYTDAGGTNCSFVDNGELVEVYIVHSHAEGVNASQFRLDVSATGWTHLGDTWNYAVAIGTSVNGVSIGYGECETSPFVVGVARFMGSSTPAAEIRITADPAVGEILTVDCDGYTRVGAGGRAWVNYPNPCVCETNQVPELEVVPVTLDFGYIDLTRDLTITNRGGGTLTWSLSESTDWLLLSTTSGTNRETVTVTVDRTGIAPGTYTGAITVYSNDGTETVPVQMTVPPTDPILRVAPAALAFGEYLETTMLHIFNDGAAGLAWNISSDQPWLSVLPTSGVEDGQVSVMVDRTGMSYGTYYGSLTVTSNGGNQTVTVTMMVPSTVPVLDVSPITLPFAAHQTTLPLTVSNVGIGTLSFDITSDQPWLTATPSSGATGSYVTVSVTVDRTSLAPGTYYGNLSVTSNGGAATVPVTMYVPGPELDVSPGGLTFFSHVDILYLDIFNIGGGDLTWSIVSDQTWLSASPTAGTNDGEVTVTVDRTGLAAGTYTGLLTVTSNGGTKWVGVTMYVVIPEPILLVVPTALSFEEDSVRTLTIINIGTAGMLEWQITSNAPWLSAAPTSGSADITEVNVYVDRTGLADGTHFSSLLVTSNGGNETIPVDMWVGDHPVLNVSPTVLLYSPDDTTNTFTISNTGTGPLTWSLGADQPWIEIVPPLSGTNNATVTVHVHPAQVPAGGTQTGLVTVNSNAGAETVEIRYTPTLPTSGGVIGVFTDAAGSNNRFPDPQGVIQVHFIHNNHGGASACQFMLDPGETNWSFLGDTWSFPTVIGTSIGGVSIAYGGCRPAPTYLGSASFFGTGSTVCRQIRIVPDPAAPSGQIEVVDCVFTKVFGQGGVGHVTCEDVGIPVQHTTWGRIKSMYAPDKN
jgi:hypothetical protein